MAFVVAERVKETSTTTGLGTLNLAGAVTDFQTFVAGVGNGNTCPYAIVNTGTGEWERGIGTVTDASPDTLARTTVSASSNSNNAVNFSAGTKQVFVDPLATQFYQKPSTVALPSTPAMLFTADAGLSLSNGDPVSTWSDQSGNGFDLTQALTLRPTFRSADADGLPYVEFDGSNDGLVKTGMTAYTGTDLTVYAVMRVEAPNASAGLFAFGKNGTAAGESTDTFRLRIDASVQALELRRNGSAFQGVFPVSSTQGDGLWMVYTLRFLTLRSAVFHVMQFGNGMPVGSSGWGALAYTAVGLGSALSNATPPIVTEPQGISVRHFSVYKSAHSDGVVRVERARLADKWNAVD